MPAKRAQFSIIGAGTPSFSRRWPSVMKAPQTRLVKKPRLSLTTIGVLRIFCTKSIARAERLGRGLLADDDLDQRHLLDRREEMQADEVVRPRRRLGQAGDRQGRGVGGEDRVGGQRGLGLLGRLGLDLAVLEHRLDHQLAALERAEVRRRRDAWPASRRACSCGEAAALHAACRARRRYAPCPCRPRPGRDRSARSRGRPAPRRWRCRRPSGRRRACRSSCTPASARPWAGARACWPPAGRRTACGSCSWRPGSRSSETK